MGSGLKHPLEIVLFLVIVGCNCPDARRSLGQRNALFQSQGHVKPRLSVGDVQAGQNLILYWQKTSVSCLQPARPPDMSSSNAPLVLAGLRPGLSPSSNTLAPACSHPDWRCPLILSVAGHRGLHSAIRAGLKANHALASNTLH